MKLNIVYTNKSAKEFDILENGYELKEGCLAFRSIEEEDTGGFLATVKQEKLTCVPLVHILYFEVLS